MYHVCMYGQVFNSTADLEEAADYAAGLVDQEDNWSQVVSVVDYDGELPLIPGPLASVDGEEQESHPVEGTPDGPVVVVAFRGLGDKVVRAWQDGRSEVL